MPQPASMPRPAVHPHERGEYLFQEPDRFLDVGSSPRTWGILPQIPAIDVQKRFIPTNVGNTFYRSKSMGKISVHPHERGEYAPVGPSTSISSGSSPRTWGIHREAGQRALPYRFIPTNVGNTFLSHLMPGICSVHPHERGEYLFPGGERPRSVRFIPTNVGNTTTRTFSRRCPTVHPHERGEYAYETGPKVCRFGSSPRTWGIRPGKSPA